MALTIKTNLSHRGNYGGKMVKPPEYIVIHFTGNDGDTDEGNAAYFARESLGRGAHYFVDEDSATSSTPENYIGWHCGANVYRHRECRNYNSIGIEMCSDKVKGLYVLTEKTIANTVELTKILMAKYNIPVENVLRHFDVTGKLCPEPFIRITGAWENFLKRLKGDDEVVEKSKVKINDKYYDVDRILKDGTNYIKIRDLEQAGFKISNEGNIAVLTTP